MCNACIMHFIQSLEITTLTCVGLLQNLNTYMALVVFWPHTAHNQDMACKERQDKPLRCLDQARPEGCPRVLKTDVYLGIRYVSIYDMIWYDIYVGLCIADTVYSRYIAVGGFQAMVPRYKWELDISGDCHEPQSGSIFWRVMSNNGAFAC